MAAAVSQHHPLRQLFGTLTERIFTESLGGLISTSPTISPIFSSNSPISIISNRSRISTDNPSKRWPNSYMNPNS